MMWQIFKLPSKLPSKLSSTLLSIITFRKWLNKAIALSGLWVLSINALQAQETVNQDWQKTLQEAKGKTVYFYAWGGSKPVNDYIRWATREIAKRYRVRLTHVKLADISEAVKRLKAENGAKSAIDLLWINGENFSYLKKQQLLLGSLLSTIPNSTLLATDKLPLERDFGVAMAGYEIPWGVGQFNLITHENLFNKSTITPSSLLLAAKNNPGRISYPKPPEFHGTTLLKQLLVALSNNDKRLFAPATVTAQAKLLPLLWQYLDELHPYTWQKGKAFPSSNTEQLQFYKQQKIDVAVSFNPNQLIKEQTQKAIAQTDKRVYFSQGAITNSHNLAIPNGSQNQSAAKVVINFLLSELAQTEKLNGSWGDPSVITPLLNTRSTLPAQQELHSSWQIIIENLWQQRYGA
jgi:putative thiamine transport system substrate-binding protein